MMEAQELRIGNLVINEITKEVIEVYPMMISQLSRIQGESNIKPIPLTGEWLVKLGFISNNHEFQETYFIDISTDERYDYQTLIQAIYMDDYTNIYIKDVERGNELDFSDAFIKKVKHVHDLQNLYQAMTGEELTLKTNP